VSPLSDVFSCSNPFEPNIPEVYVASSCYYEVIISQSEILIPIKLTKGKDYERSRVVTCLMEVLIYRKQFKVEIMVAMFSYIGLLIGSHIQTVE